MENQRSPVASVAVNLCVLGASWGIAAVLGSWLSTSAAITVGLGCGIALAWKARAHVAVFVLAGLFAAVASELVAGSLFGSAVIRGRMPHLAVVGSGLLGVFLGALLFGGGALLALRRTVAPSGGAAVPASTPPADLLSRVSS